MNDNTRMTGNWSGTLGVLAGIYLIVAPWLMGFSDNTGATTNSWIAGLVVAASSLVALAAPLRADFAGIVTLLAGVWLIVSPWVAGFSDNGGGTTSTWIAGVVVAILGIGQAMAASTHLAERSGDRHRVM